MMNQAKTYTKTYISHTLLNVMLLGSVLLLNACAITPSTIVKTPTSAKPTPLPAAAAETGAIFNVAAYKPLFEDRRARMVGDIMTINITENTAAKKANASASSKNGSIAAAAAVPTGLPIKFMDEAVAIGATSKISNDDSATDNASNNFNGFITVTVVEVLANGNLVVSGEKQIALDKGTEFVRFSGVVNPDTVTAGNIVASTKVADARIEYRTNTKIDGAQIAAILTRFFLSFSPL